MGGTPDIVAAILMGLDDIAEKAREINRRQVSKSTRVRDPIRVTLSEHQELLFVSQLANLQRLFALHLQGWESAEVADEFESPS
ncbi:MULTISPECIES: hypothetical protein [unclassified Crossiella]|uniref:hypothetical protein n=1 Tax=unclassified Crossiella TaxID=2620835 RepID=UPI001FFE3689|nr:MULTISPECIES: hypothetical protein [unclassified Crossiella]MCK2243934.1 hypothetical protein [Crossiella sp. S99.2]MCK2257208.1 hypothetical protein [Crossiella sp. S99.1]